MKEIVEALDRGGESGAREAVRLLEEMRVAAESIRQPHEPIWSLADAFYRGFQGLTIFAGRLILAAGEGGVESFYTNMIRPRIRAMVAQLTSNRPNPHAVLADEDDTDAGEAVPLAQEILRGVLRYVGLDRKLRLATHGAANRGNGLLHAGYDGSLGDERAEYHCGNERCVDESGNHTVIPRDIVERIKGGLDAPARRDPSGDAPNPPGMVDDARALGCPVCGEPRIVEKMRRVGDFFLTAIPVSRALYDPASTSLDDASWVILEHHDARARAASRFPVDSLGRAVEYAEEDLEVGADVVPATELGFSAQPRRKGVRLYEFLHVGAPGYPRGLRVLWHGEHVLDARDRISGDGGFPLAEILADDDDSSPYKRGITPDMIPPQIALNKQFRNLLEISDLARDPRKTAEEGSLVLDHAHTQTDERVLYYRQGKARPEFEQPPEISPVHENLIGLLLFQMDVMAQQYAPARGEPGSGVTSGTQARLLIERTATALSSISFSIERAVARIGKVLIMDAQEFMPDERVLSYAGDYGKPAFVRFKRADLAGVQDVVVEGGSAFPESREARREFMLSLADRLMKLDPPSREYVTRGLEMGTIMPPDPLDLPRKKAKDENDRMADGEIVAVATSDIHDVEIAVHRQFQQRPLYQRLAPETKGEIQAHIDAHEEEMHLDIAREKAKSAAIDEAAREMMPGGALDAPALGASPANGPPNGGMIQ